jgi:hypothetical protein
MASSGVRFVFNLALLTYLSQRRSSSVILKSLNGIWDISFHYSKTKFDSWAPPIKELTPLQFTIFRYHPVTFDQGFYENEAVCFHLAALVTKRLRLERMLATTWIASLDVRCQGI